MAGRGGCEDPGYSKGFQFEAFRLGAFGNRTNTLPHTPVVVLIPTTSGSYLSHGFMLGSHL